MSAHLLRRYHCSWYVGAHRAEDIALGSNEFNNRAAPQHQLPFFPPTTVETASCSCSEIASCPYVETVSKHGVRSGRVILACAPARETVSRAVAWPEIARGKRGNFYEISPPTKILVAGWLLKKSQGGPGNTRAGRRNFQELSSAIWDEEISRNFLQKSDIKISDFGSKKSRFLKKVPGNFSRFQILLLLLLLKKSQGGPGNTRAGRRNFLELSLFCFIFKTAVLKLCQHKCCVLKLCQHKFCVLKLCQHKWFVLKQKFVLF